MDCKATASLLGLRNRRLSAKQNSTKRVSFKDEIWVIHIPAREESAVKLRDSIIFTRNSLAGNSCTNNRPDITNRQASLETFSSTSLYANGGQRCPQTTQTSMSSGQETSRPPYKSILKIPTSSQRRESHLNHTYLPAKSGRQVSARRDFSDSYNNFKYDSSHLLPSRDTISRLERLEKPAFTRSLPPRHTWSISRGMRAGDGALNNKTTRLLGQDISFNRTSSDYDYNHNDKARTINAAKQPQDNFDIVGVTYGRVNKMPYFYDISGIMNGVKEYTPVTNLPNDRSRLEHSAVSTLNPFDSKRETRHLSAVPAIATFNRKTRDTRKHVSSTWTHEYDSSPKRQLPMAWQPAKQYNFSTK